MENKNCFSIDCLDFEGKMVKAKGLSVGSNNVGVMLPMQADAPHFYPVSRLPIAAVWCLIFTRLLARHYAYWLRNGERPIDSSVLLRRQASLFALSQAV